MRSDYLLPVLLLLAHAGPLAAQAPDEPPVAVLRGVLTGWDLDGKLIIATRDRVAHSCTFDDKTFLTSRLGRLKPEQIEVGSRVDAVFDYRDGGGACKALTIYVLILDRSRVDDKYEQQYRDALARQRHLLDHIHPRGDQTFAGVVAEASAKHLVLRTPTGRIGLQLRYDTRFTDQGKAADWTMLEVNSRVFVRGGQSIDGRLEAYQAIRGDILMPD